MNLNDNDYFMSQREVAEIMFVDPKTISSIERRALEKIRIIFRERGIDIKDLLED
jgi:DNA-directed RNA polymerase specialized sigma24 family protein